MSSDLHLLNADRFSATEHVELMALVVVTVIWILQGHSAVAVQGHLLIHSHSAESLLLTLTTAMCVIYMHFTGRLMENGFCL